MKKHLLIGLIIAFNLNVMAIDSSELNENNNTEEEKKKTYVINLDKEQKDADKRGVADDIIRGIIPLGHNDEVTFFGKKVLISKGIKIYINGIYKKSIKVVNRMFTLQTSDLNVGDKVTVKTKGNDTLVEKVVAE